MRYLFISAIHLYRRLVPPDRRRRCLFRESCSMYIERIAREEGTLAVMFAMVKRLRSCRPGYEFHVLQENNCWELVCVDGSRFPQSEVASHIVAEYHAIMGGLSIENQIK